MDFLASLSDPLTKLAAFVFVVSFLVFFHEGGHFLVAKLFKFPVEVFSLGFGKRLFGVTRGGTDYRVSLVPLGGYVRVVGLGPDETDVVEGGKPHDQGLRGTRWQRILVLLAGPAVNLVLALLLTAGAFAVGVRVPKYQDEAPVVKHVDAGTPAERAGIHVDDLIVTLSGKPVTTWREVQTDLAMQPRTDIKVGILRGGERLEVVIRPEPDPKYDIGTTGLNPDIAPVVGDLVPGYPGALAGMKPGDRVLSVAGKPVATHYDVVRRVGEAAAPFDAKGASPLAFEIERDGARQTLEITPKKDGKFWRVGYRPREETVLRRMGFGRALVASWNENLSQVPLLYLALKRVVTQGAIRQLSGPLDIAKFSGEAVRLGPAALLAFMGMISLQLGLLNLLPIPLLDGGQIAITLVESAVRRDLPLKLKERLLQAGFVFLMLLMVVVISSDLLKRLPALSKAIGL